jgi:hypothetical protein
MVGGLIAANSSTILTHLNWGASYLVHDFYRRFIKTDADELHYVFVGRLATVFLFLASSATVYLMDSAKDTFDIILQIGAGTGLLYLVRWYWWRVNAWCEVVAMTSSLLVSIGLLVASKNGVHLGPHFALPFTVLVTTACWVATAFLAPQTDRRTLVAFYKKVRPSGPGWASIRAEASLTPAEQAEAQMNIPLALLGWSAACTMIWSALFTIGTYLYGRTTQSLMLGVVFVVSATVVINVMRTLFADSNTR